MPFARKTLLGLSQVISNLKTWCNSTFAPKSHTHTKLQVTGMNPSWPAYPKHTLLLNTKSLSEVQAFSYTATDNCWIRIRAVGDTYGCASFEEHVLALVVSSTYSDGSRVNDIEVFRANFSRDFYRNDNTAVIPIRKGDVIKVTHSSGSHPNTPRLGFSVIVYRISSADWNNV